MWKQEGFQGFMKGNGINVVRVSLAERLDLTLDEELIRSDTSILGFAIHCKLEQ
jgi:hypothetical protein